MPLPVISDESLESLRTIFTATVKAVRNGQIEQAEAKSEYRREVYDRLQKLGALDRDTSPEDFCGAMNALLRDEEISPRVAEALYGDRFDGTVYESDVNYYLTEAYGGHDHSKKSIRRFGGGGQGKTRGAPKASP